MKTDKVEDKETKERKKKKNSNQWIPGHSGLWTEDVTVTTFTTFSSITPQ